jgi:hypothetical protein
MEEEHRTPHSEDRLTEFMFGSRSTSNDQPEKNSEPQSYIDYEQMFVHIDDLMESARNLKPLFQKVFPFVEQIWKKK